MSLQLIEVESLGISNFLRNCYYLHCVVSLIRITGCGMDSRIDVASVVSDLWG